MKRGVSEIIGSLLVLFITFLLGTALFLIANQQFNYQQFQIQREVEINDKLINEKFIVEHVHKRNITTLEILIRNLGFMNVTITKILIYNSTFTKLFKDLNIVIQPNTNYIFLANLNTTIKSNTAYTISVFSEIFYANQPTGRGNVYTVSWVSP